MHYFSALLLNLPYNILKERAKKANASDLKLAQVLLIYK